MDTPPKTGLSRRSLLARAGTVAAGSVTLTGGFAEVAHANAHADTHADTDMTADPAPEFTPVRITPTDIRYDSLLRGDNFRFAGHPEEIRVVTSTQDVLHVVAEAVRAGKRVAVRSGGHCFENFTADPAVEVLLDMSQMNAVGYDPAMRAFSIQPGARLGEIYTTLFKGWAVTLPAGGCPDVGAGGHFTGGGYGPLSRRYGSVVDHLYAVEVVVVDEHGRARVVRATREPDDPHRDLWWAHAGGGGGNFGVVTRFWFRSPGATGADPAKLLPPVPGQMYFFVAEWGFTPDMTRDLFTTIVRNFGRWHEQHSAPGAPGTGLYAILEIGNINNGLFNLVVQADGGLPDVEGQVAELFDAVTAGTVKPVHQGGYLPWLHMTTWPGDGEAGDKVSRRYKLKAASLKNSYTDEHLAATHAGLADNSAAPVGAAMLLIGYGGQVQAVSPDATAVAQRDVVMKSVFSTTWMLEKDDAANIQWMREFYRSIYAATGGVPVPDDVSDGSYINYPDVDLADPAWNTSGVPWSELYYKDNYPKLQQIKAAWDPGNVFRHALSIELPA